MFKLSSANANEATQTLKLLVSEPAMKRQIDKKLEMIGIDRIAKGAAGCSQEMSEVSEKQ